VPQTLSFPLSQDTIELFPGATNVEEPEVVIHRLPGREVCGNQTLLAAGADHVEDVLHDEAHRPLAVPATQLGGRDQWFQDCPFRVGQVGRIEVGRRGHVQLRRGGTPRISPRHPPSLGRFSRRVQTGSAGLSTERLRADEGNYGTTHSALR